MTRYWQHMNGRVVRTEGGVYDYAGFTEVQVVPLDAIVIDRADLPEVTEGNGANAPVGSLRTVNGYHQPLNPSWQRDLACHHLALAEYVKAHPPVNQALVRALAEEFRNIDMRGINVATLAETLVKAGWSK